MRICYRTLTTDRLILRRPLFSDAADVFRCLSDEGVCRYIDVDRHRTLADSESFLKRLIQEDRAGIGTEWMIEEKNGKRVIGIIHLSSLSEDFAYIGYFIEKRRWGNGFATEALAALKTYVFSQEKFSRLYALCLPDNKASLCVLEKCGFSFEKKGECRGGKHHGKEIYRYEAKKIQP